MFILGSYTAVCQYIIKERMMMMMMKQANRAVMCCQTPYNGSIQVTTTCVKISTGRAAWNVYCACAMSLRCSDVACIGPR